MMGVYSDRRNCLAANDGIGVGFDATVVGKTGFAIGVSGYTGSRAKERSSGAGMLANMAARTTTKARISLQQDAAHGMKPNAPEPTGFMPLLGQLDQHAQPTIDQLTNRILGKWSHEPLRDTHRRREAS
jgi:hypothetical protein